MKTDAFVRKEQLRQKGSNNGKQRDKCSSTRQFRNIKRVEIGERDCLILQQIVRWYSVRTDHLLGSGLFSNYETASHRMGHLASAGLVKHYGPIRQGGAGRHTATLPGTRMSGAGFRPSNRANRLDIIDHDHLVMDAAIRLSKQAVGVSGNESILWLDSERSLWREFRSGNRPGFGRLPDLRINWANGNRTAVEVDRSIKGTFAIHRMVESMLTGTPHVANNWSWYVPGRQQAEKVEMIVAEYGVDNIISVFPIQVLNLPRRWEAEPTGQGPLKAIFAVPRGEGVCDE